MAATTPVSEVVAAPFEHKTDLMDETVQLDATDMDMVERDVHEACGACHLVL